MENLYSLEHFHLMNKSLFEITIKGDHYQANEITFGVSGIHDRLIFLQDPPVNEDLFRVFCTNNSDTYQKLYLDLDGNIELSVVIKLLK